MAVDRILKQNEVLVLYSTRDASLVVQVAAVSDRVLRTVVNSTIDSLKSVIETFDEFDK